MTGETHTTASNRTLFSSVRAGRDDTTAGPRYKNTSISTTHISVVALDVTMQVEIIDLNLDSLNSDL